MAPPSKGRRDGPGRNAAEARRSAAEALVNNCFPRGFEWKGGGSLEPTVTHFRPTRPTRAGRSGLLLWPRDFAAELSELLSTEAQTRVDVLPDPEGESEHDVLLVTRSPHAEAQSSQTVEPSASAAAPNRLVLSGPAT